MTDLAIAAATVEATEMPAVGRFLQDDMDDEDLEEMMNDAA